MKLRISNLLALPLSLALSMTACGDDTNTGGGEEESESGSETDGGDGDGDESDSDEGGTDSATTTPGTTDETDTDECSIGAEGCPCTNGGSCDAGLMCEDGICVPADPATGDGDGDDPTTGDGDGDTTGDGDGDPTTGDGDGDTTGGGACQGEEFIQIEAVDADYEGWEPVMSMLGEGEILAWIGDDPEAFVSFDIDVPCDDDWTVWVRAINAGQDDSFFATVDGGPDPAAIFEIACDQGPQNATYEWNDLNWREGGPCEYLEDPWIQTWDAGQHNLTLSYRESYAITRIWVTNTDQMPPNP